MGFLPKTPIYIGGSMKEYKMDLEIDKNDLDNACLQQPMLFDIYAQKVVSLCKLKEELELEIKNLSAKLDGVIREAASAEGKKITEAMIQNEIIRNIQYADLQYKYLNIYAEVEEAKVIKEAFQQRKDMLRLLTELYISGYWGSVETKVVKQQATESIKDRLKEKMLEEKKER